MHEYHQMTAIEIAAFGEFLSTNDLSGSAPGGKLYLQIERNDPRFEWIDTVNSRAPITNENRNRTVFIGRMHFNVVNNMFYLSPTNDDTAIDFMRNINAAMQLKDPGVKLAFPKGYDELPTSRFSQEGYRLVQEFADEHGINMTTPDGERVVMRFEPTDVRLPIFRSSPDATPVLDLDTARWTRSPSGHWIVKPLQAQSPEAFVEALEDAFGVSLELSQIRRVTETSSINSNDMKFAIGFIRKQMRDEHDHTLYDAILARAEDGSDPAYTQSFVKWLGGEAGTLVLRDELCGPFRTMFDHLTVEGRQNNVWFNAFARLDSAKLAYKEDFRIGNMRPERFRAEPEAQHSAGPKF